MVFSKKKKWLRYGFLQKTIYISYSANITEFHLEKTPISFFVFEVIGNSI